jgi:Lrp/AsnC family leucine-responsive transcriptional regulator
MMSSEFNSISSTLDATDLQLLAALQADASISNIALADKLHISAATCLRRTKRLLQEGWIEKQVAILSSDKLGQFLGHSVTALIEVSLDKQGEELLQAFETRAVQETAVQQCWRVSPGPDFMLVWHANHVAKHLSIRPAKGSLQAFSLMHRHSPRPSLRLRRFLRSLPIGNAHLLTSRHT